MNCFPQIGLLITHFNRSRSLENLLNTLQTLNCDFGQIVVSDDGSKKEHIEYIEYLQSLYSFTLLKTSINKGLGNNINKGQDSINTPFTLYIQEDFVPTSFFPKSLKDALLFMEGDKDLDMVRFYSYLRYPCLKYFDKGFSEMQFPLFSFNYKKVYLYSDHPHLRRSSFFQKFGRYTERIKADKTEYDMCVSFIQKKGKSLFYDDFQKLFVQKNTINEPSTMLRDSWKHSNNFLIGILRDLYRQIKYNYDILFVKTKF